MSTRTGPNGRPVRAYELPASISGRLWVWRYLIFRRICQVAILLLFFGTFHWGWTAIGEPLLAGNLTSSTFLGLVPLADPFATMQILLTGHLLKWEVLIGALIVLAFYGLLGGRVWCSWVCPVNMVTDLAGWLHTRLAIKNVFHVGRYVRYAVLGLTLVMSVMTGVAAFEWISPIGIFHREVIFGIGIGWTAVIGVFLFDLLILKHGWCGHLCPLGAFYSLIGRVAPLRVRFDAPTCTYCGECARVCPEPQVLNLIKATEAGFVASGECSNCARCIPVCPEDTLSFGYSFPKRQLEPEKASAQGTNS